MKVGILAITLTFFFLDTPIGLFAEASEDSFFIRSIAKESLNIEYAAPYDHSTLSDLHASRGEDYLILGEDQKALEDFLISYEYALNCKENDHLSFRSLFGVFLAYVRLENLESAQEVYAQLETILKGYRCRREKKAFMHLSKTDFQGIANSMQYCRANHPILGPEKIPIDDCLDNVNGAVKAITILIAAVKKAEIRAIALTLINQLADTARNCCWAGGLWKGCLQELVNKLHYWKVFGIPANPAWDD
jgi:hypothetical protein